MTALDPTGHRSTFDIACKARKALNAAKSVVNNLENAAAETLTVGCGALTGGTTAAATYGLN